MRNTWWVPGCGVIREESEGRKKDAALECDLCMAGDTEECAHFKKPVKYIRAPKEK